MSSAASLDLRLPIGALFSALGIIIGGYGIVTNGNHALYEQSMSININLWWGLVMLIVGVLMFMAGMRASRQGRAASEREAMTTPEGRATEAREHRTGLER